jgi:hypothetical protein
MAGPPEPLDPLPGARRRSSGGSHQEAGISGNGDVIVQVTGDGNTVVSNMSSSNQLSSANERPVTVPLLDGATRPYGDGLLALLRAATSAVPVVKWALGVAGVGAAGALLLGVAGGRPHLAAIGVPAMLMLMVVLLLLAVLARASKRGELPRMFYLPALIFLWTSTCLVVAIPASIFSAWAFGAPARLARWLDTNGKGRSAEILADHVMFFGTGWVFAGYYSQSHEGFQEGPYLKVVYRPNSPARGLLLPQLGDILQIIKPRSVMIADFHSAGTREALISPPLVHDPLVPGDRTGVTIPAGRLVMVRDVEMSGYPGRPPSVWCRVIECDTETDGCLKAATELTAQ